MKRNLNIIYAPNSIYYGTHKRHFSEFELNKIGYERLKDFVEFLFDHSSHCDHISQSEAWKEFEDFELKNKSKLI